MTTTTAAVIGGVDTHADTHYAAALDPVGRLLGSRQFRADGAGYRQLLSWLASFGSVQCIGVEGTGCYGAGLTRFLRQQDVSVVEVNRPDRRMRRTRGKSDPLDAENAARRALARRTRQSRRTRPRSWSRSVPCAWPVTARSRPAPRR